MGGSLIKKDNVSNVSVYQHNAITEARYEMSSLQKNILYMLLTKLNEEDLPGKYKLSIQEINNSRKVRIRREELRQATKGLIDSVITIYDEVQKRFITIAILHSADYGDGIDKENLIIEFDPKLYPFLQHAKRKFTVFSLQNALKLHSKYSKRIYEMLCQFKSTGVFRITVQELKQRFNLIDTETGKDTYLKFGEFSRKVLEVAKKEINENTDISFEYITKNTGRKITDLEFKITYKSSGQESIEPIQIQPIHIEEDDSLKDRLISKFNLSKTLAKKVIENIPTGEINKILYNIQLKNSNRGLENIGAYATKVFQNRLDGAEVLIKQSSNLAKQASISTDLPADQPRDNKCLEEREVVVRAVSNERLNGPVPVGDHIAQVFNPTVQRTIEKKVLSDEERKLKEDKWEAWASLHRFFKIDTQQVDDLLERYPIESLKVAIDSVLKTVANEDESIQDHTKMIDELKNRLNLI